MHLLREATNLVEELIVCTFNTHCPIGTVAEGPRICNLPDMQRTFCLLSNAETVWAIVTLGTSEKLVLTSSTWVTKVDHSRGCILHAGKGYCDRSLLLLGEMLPQSLELKGKHRSIAVFSAN